MYNQSAFDHSYYGNNNAARATADDMQASASETKFAGLQQMRTVKKARPMTAKVNKRTLY
jgi:hypothetical protein